MQQTELPAYDQSSAIVEKVRALLENSEKSLPEIYKETGIPFYWLRSFASGRYKKNPSVNRVIYLYEYLTGKGLEI